MLSRPKTHKHCSTRPYPIWFSGEGLQSRRPQELVHLATRYGFLEQAWFEFWEKDLSLTLYLPNIFCVATMRSLPANSSATNKDLKH